MSERSERRNFILGVLNGAIFAFGVAFLDPSTVMPVFMKRFTQSDAVVGLASSLRRAGWYLPQLFMAGLLESKPYRLRYYVGANIVRMILIWSFVPILIHYAVSDPSVVLWAFLVLFTVSSLFGGVAGIPFTDIVGRTISKSQRGPFYALRVFFGAGLLSIVAGFVIQWILGESGGFEFPGNYAAIFVLSALFMSIGVACFAFVKEPPGRSLQPTRSVRSVVAEIPAILRADRNFKRFLVCQVLSAGLGFSLPFYVLSAKEWFGIPEADIGLLLAVQTAGATVSNIFWGRISSKSGNLRVIQWTIGTQLLVPIYALAVINTPGLLGSGALSDFGTMLFLPVFFLIGAALSAEQVGFRSFLLDVSPESRRPTYVGITNTTMGCASFFPAIGGLLVELMDLRWVIGLSALSILGAAYYSMLLKDPE